METEKVGPVSNWPLPICTLAGRGIRFSDCWACASTPGANNAHSITARIVRTIRSPIALRSDDYADIRSASIVERSMLCKLPIGRYAARVVSIPVVQRSGGRLTVAPAFQRRADWPDDPRLGRLKCSSGAGASFQACLRHARLPGSLPATGVAGYYRRSLPDLNSSSGTMVLGFETGHYWGRKC